MSIMQIRGSDRDLSSYVLSWIRLASQVWAVIISFVTRTSRWATTGSSNVHEERCGGVCTQSTSIASPPRDVTMHSYVYISWRARSSSVVLKIVQHAVRWATKPFH
jgi:hypothetical protein